MDTREYSKERRVEWVQLYFNVMNSYKICEFYANKYPQQNKPNPTIILNGSKNS